MGLSHRFQKRKPWTAEEEQTMNMGLNKLVGEKYFMMATHIFHKKSWLKHLTDNLGHLLKRVWLKRVLTKFTLTSKIGIEMDFRDESEIRFRFCFKIGQERMQPTFVETIGGSLCFTFNAKVDLEKVTVMYLDCNMIKNPPPEPTIEQLCACRTIEDIAQFEIFKSPFTPITLATPDTHPALFSPN